ncbi:MAG: EAL domain-containing protein [Acidobacteriota bacterium]|nr:EAL domain-containing protein [Acidobacteriota bacterium]
MPVDQGDRYRDLFMNVYVGLFKSCVSTGRINDCNDYFARLLGYSSREQCISECVARRHYVRPEERRDIMEDLRNEGRIMGRELEVQRLDHTLIWVNFSSELDAAGDEITGAVVEITGYKQLLENLENEVKERTATLRGSRRMLQLVMDNIPQAIFWKDLDSVYQGCNKRFARDAGFQNPEELIGLTDFDLPWKREESEWYRICDREVMTSGKAQKHIQETQRQADGTEAEVKTNKIPLIDESGEVMGVLGTYEDVTQFKQQKEQLQKLTNYDVLTGLANRKLFKERLHHALRGFSRGNHALLLIDLDHFKTINDSLGHHFGDRLLVAFGHRLRRSIPLEHMVARLGGDEFGVLLENVGTRKHAGAVAGELMDELKQPCRLEGHEIVITPSIGIALFPNHGKTPKDLLRNADAAMFLAKSKGRNTYRFFSEELNRQAMERLEMETRLRKALELDEFLVYYQPKVDIRSGAFTGLEALVRWQPSDREGLVGPDAFIPLAEETGLILEISEIVLRRACLTARAWMRDNLPFGRIAVNMSPYQFRQDNLVDRITHILDETGFPADRLELEITESALMDQTNRIAMLMERIRELGIHLSLDDFGTGYSSLSNLKHFPLNTLKIDRSFITDIARSTKDRNIAASIVGLGHYLGLNVIAEGVENRDQVSILKGLRCEQMQGFYFSEPVPEQEMRRILETMARKK